MARCTICFHRRLNQMDAAILNGESLASISERHKVSVDALGRHKKQMRSAMDLALAKQPNRAHDLGYGNELLDVLSNIVA